MLEELNRGVSYLTRDFIELLDHHYSTFKIHDAIGVTNVEWKINRMQLKHHGMSAQEVLLFHLLGEDSYAAYLNKVHHNVTNFN